MCPFNITIVGFFTGILKANTYEKYLCSYNMAVVTPDLSLPEENQIFYIVNDSRYISSVLD